MHLDEEAGPVELPTGKIVGRRWKVIDKLGEGGCGAVYLVEDTSTRAKAALKAESNFVAGGSVLKLEVQVLKRLQGRKFVAQLISSGKKEKYSYMVMTLFGASLSRLFKQCKKTFEMSTQIRLGMQILYGIKQLHDVGYIHRDIKPANLAIGRKGIEARMLHLLDFGLAREYIIRDPEGKAVLRAPRSNTLFRGTTKYCSINTHMRSEQGRSDDLWSMVYVMAEMRGQLPWDHLREKRDIKESKQATSAEVLLKNSPPELRKITEHIGPLNYYQRPNYELIFSILQNIMKQYNIKYSDPFDWEQLPAATGAIATTPTTSKSRGKRSRIMNILSVSEDKSVVKTTEATTMDTKPAPATQTAEELVSVDVLPFTSKDFSRKPFDF